MIANLASRTCRCLTAHLGKMKIHFFLIFASNL